MITKASLETRLKELEKQRMQGSAQVAQMQAAVAAIGGAITETRRLLVEFDKPDAVPSKEVIEPTIAKPEVVEPEVE